MGSGYHLVDALVDCLLHVQDITVDLLDVVGDFSQRI